MYSIYLWHSFATQNTDHIGELIAISVCFRLVKSPNLVQHWYRWYHFFIFPIAGILDGKRKAAFKAESQAG